MMHHVHAIAAPAVLTVVNAWDAADVHAVAVTVYASPVANRGAVPPFPKTAGDIVGMLEDATAHLTATLRTATAISVTYSQGAISHSGIMATRGSTVFEATDNDGIIHRTQSRDYLIAVDDFPFDGHPQDGEVITDNGETYVVYSMPGEHPWRFADPGKSLYRIHTKFQA